MSRIADHLANYAAYHRDGRNVATHMLGIPLIVLAIQLLLARPVLLDDPAPVTPALAVSAMAVWYYLWLDLRLGLVMAVLLSLGVVLTEAVAAAFPASRIVLAVGVFVVGWVLQFIGHWFEGRKPAFFDELVSLLIGPLFIVAEVLFALGLFPALKQAVAQRAAAQQPPAHRKAA